VDSVAEKALISFQLEFPAFSFAVPRCLHRPSTIAASRHLFGFPAEFLVHERRIKVMNGRMQLRFGVRQFEVLAAEKVEKNSALVLPWAISGHSGFDCVFVLGGCAKHQQGRYQRD